MNMYSTTPSHRQSFHFDDPRTPDRRTHRCKFNTARGPFHTPHLYHGVPWD